MTIFIDASFLIALFNLDDDFHEKAEKISKKLEETASKFLTSNIVLMETVNLIFRLKGPKEAREFLSVYKKSGIEEVFLTKEMYNLGYKYLFLLKTKNNLNLFDCLHLATMKKLEIETIATFDQDFKNKAKIVS